MNRAAATAFHAFILGGLLSPVALADWSDDASANLSVADGPATQSNPIVRPAADGGVWIFFYDNSAGTGLKPVIQRLSPWGEKLFSGNGVVLADRHNSAIFTSDMKVDAVGNAYAAFDDDSTGTTRTTVQKITPNGSLPWGASGIQMPAGNNSLGNRIAPCTDGTIVWAGVVSSVLQFQRMNADGTLVAGESWSLTETGRAQAPSDLISGNSGGDVILLWIRAEGSNIVTSRKGLKIQKWDSTHAPQWTGTGGPGSAVDIYVSAASPSKSIQSGYFPPLVPDGSGGAVVAWYDNGAARNAWLQHVNAAGAARFAQDGVAASTTSSATEFRLSAAGAYDAAADEYVVAYERSNPLQSLYGLGAQRIQADGTLLWGAGAGLEILPIAGFHKSFINTLRGPSGSAVIAWLEYTGANGPMLVNATRIDSSGAAVWSPGTLAVCSSASPKGRLGVTGVVGSDSLVAAWHDDASGTTDIRAQNILIDGALGLLPCPADLDGDHVVGLGDLTILLSNFGTTGASAADGDLTGEGDVDLGDLTILLSEFGEPCPY
jgi:hypothetical protein